MYNLNYLYQTQLVEAISNLFNNSRAIILFGSFRWGKDVSGSDIDLAIETDEEVNNGYQILSLRQFVANNKEDLALITNIEDHINRKIQIHVFNKKYRENMDINVFSNIANGIVLRGFLEVKP